MIEKTAWFILPINAEPWAVGPVGYNGKTKKAYVGRNQQLDAYQQAVKEQIAIRYSNFAPLEGLIELNFWFWRQLSEYENKLNNRKTTKHKVDATNLQKALEDALQGSLYLNDNQTRKIRSEIVQQGTIIEPRIIISLKPWLESDLSNFPDDVWAVFNNIQQLDFSNSDQRW